MKSKIVFVTGTRADFGKLKSLMHRLQKDENFEIHIFVTGMHMLAKYGYTCGEVENEGFLNIFKFFNQNSSDSMDHALSKTIMGLSDYVREIKPDLIIIHGDRIEALAGAAVGALNNIRVGHIEGGEVSGTVDELIRHAVSKLSHVHFVANETAKIRLRQLGESEESIFVIGSPDIDIMNSASLPTIKSVQTRYGFEFEKYAILMFHPVTSELKELRRQIKVLVDQVISSNIPYIVIYPNNDHGTDVILEEYARFNQLENFRVFPSVRFEYFLTMLKNAQFIIGNSSVGVREAPHFGVPSINIGTRQNNRVKSESILNVDNEHLVIADAIQAVSGMSRVPVTLFGHGESSDKFHQILNTSDFWQLNTQKFFVDRLMQ